MDINKELSLGKSYKSVPNGSLVAARNICIDSDTINIIREPGFKDVLANLTDDNKIEGYIVGVIPTVKDLIIFTYNEDTDKSHIYIVNNEIDVNGKRIISECNHDWKHIGNTRFIGDYTTDPAGRYIVAVCEYTDDCDKTNYTKYPLRSWTLITDDDYEEQSSNGLIKYNDNNILKINPDIPRFNIDRYIRNGGNLITGVYTFFIRFKINNYDYTNWFQLTDDIIITNNNQKKKPKHFYQIGFALDSANTQKFKSYTVNKEGYSPYLITIQLENIDESWKYSVAEVAYIFKHEANVVGRYFLDLKLTDNFLQFSLYNNEYITEVSIDDLLRSPSAIFNVKSLCNYSNRLYCANYFTHYDEAKSEVENYLENNVVIDSNSTYYNNSVNRGNINKDTVTLSFDFMYHSDNISLEKTVEISKVTGLTAYGLTGTWYQVKPSDVYDIFNEMFSTYVIDYSNSSVSQDDANKLENFVKGAYACDQIYCQENPGKSSDDADKNVIVKLSVLLSVCSRRSTPTGIVLWWNGKVRTMAKSLNKYADYVKADVDSSAKNDDNIYQGKMLYSENLDYPELDELVWNSSLGSEYKNACETYSRDKSDAETNPIPAFELYVNKDNEVALLDKTFAQNVGNNHHNAIAPLRAKAYGNSYPQAVLLTSVNNYNMTVALSYRALHLSGAKNTTLDGETIYLASEQFKMNKKGDRKEAWDRWVPRLIYQDADKTLSPNTHAWEFTPAKFSNAKLKCSAEISLKEDNIDVISTIKNNINITDTPTEYKISDSINIPRTLLPYQNYNIFKHFVRSDYTVTLGYPVNCDEFIQECNPNTIYKFKVNNEKYYGDDYIGYFYTYEDIIKSVNWNIYTQIDSSYYFTNCRVIYDDLIYHFPNIAGTTNTVTYKYDKFNKLSENAIEIESIDGDDGDIFYTTKNVEYKNDVKTLYQLTPRYFIKKKHNWTNEYLPGFINREVSILYKQNIIANADSLSITSLSQSQVDYDIANATNYVYSDVPIFTYNVKQDYEIIQQTFIDANNKLIGTYTSNVILPNKIGDFLEIQAAYTAKPSKTYTNYREQQYLNTFPTTIWRSNQISDESYENRFRQFETDQYKIIHENKGEITNIIGVGTTLLIHTENSIFQFDRSPRLSSKLTPEIKDTFDVQYSELFPTQNGWGGLQDNYDCLLCPAGYIWYDHLTKNIFRFDENTPKILSSDIDQFLKKLDIVSVRFAYDFTNRLLICIWYVPNGSAKRELSMCQTITLSYDLNLHKYISLHDFSFTRGYNTYNKLYLYNEIKANNKLFVFDKNSYDYLELTDTEHSYIPSFKVNGVFASYVDIIVNNAYETTKCIESINYILNTIDKSLGMFDNVDRYKKYSGNALTVYSDSCYSGLLDIYVDNKNINVMNNYKYPFYNKGTWNINYFRNRLSANDLNVNNVEELKTTIVAQDENGNFITKEISMEELRKQQALKKTDDEIKGSDNKSIIYGKYIVVRLIIDRRKDFMLETLNINLNQY